MGVKNWYMSRPLTVVKVGGDVPGTRNWVSTKAILIGLWHHDKCSTWRFVGRGEGFGGMGGEGWGIQWAKTRGEDQDVGGVHATPPYIQET